jgi:hypothetical protein
MSLAVRATSLTASALPRNPCFALPTSLVHWVIESEDRRTARLQEKKRKLELQMNAA